MDLLAAKASPCDRDKLRIAQFYVDNKDALIQSKHYAIEMPVGGKANLRRMTDTYEHIIDLIELSEDGIESFWLDAFGAVNDENELTAEERSLKKVYYLLRPLQELPISVPGEKVPGLADFDKYFCKPAQYKSIEDMAYAIMCSNVGRSNCLKLHDLTKVWDGSLRVEKK